MCKRVLKIVLLIVVFLISFSLGSCKGANSENISYEYIRVSEIAYRDKENVLLINNIEELKDYVALKDIEKCDKYDDEFFENKSIIMYFNTESSGGNRSKIKSYEIDDNKISIYVETYEYGITCDMAYYLFILEINKEETNKFNTIVINKNGKDIIVK